MVDNSTAPVTVLVTGTGWSVNVTACNLDTSTGNKDFEVTTGTTIYSNALFIKTSATSLTYTGAALPASTSITVKRVTPITRIAELIGYGSKISTVSYEAELNRLQKICAEFIDRIVNLEAGGGIGGSPVNDGVYSAAWDGDTSGAPSRNAVYDKIEAFVNSTIGQITPFATIILPFGWLECNGQAVSRATYSKLFAAIGVTYGAGNGTTTFNVPGIDGQVIAQRTGARIFNSSFGSTAVSVPLPQHNHTATSTTKPAFTPFIRSSFTPYASGVFATQPTNDVGAANTNLNTDPAWTPTITVNNAGVAFPTLEVTQPTRYLVHGINTGGQ